MVTWEIMRLEGDDASKSQDEFFPISYTCKCGRKWGSINKQSYTNTIMSEEKEVTETTEVQQDTAGNKKVKKTETVEDK